MKKIIYKIFSGRYKYSAYRNCTAPAGCFVKESRLLTRGRVILIMAILVYAAIDLGASEFSISAHLGYMPETGGSMSSGWQAENLHNRDGIYDINRSKDGVAISTVDVPAGFVAGADMRIIKETVYFKAGIDYVYMMTGGKGSTLDPSGTEVVDVTYQQWSVDVPFTFGIALLFWNEARIYLGIGIAMAYGTYSNSFKSASLDHNASFTGYALPLVAEAGCEYLFSERVSAGCNIKYLYGQSRVIEDGDDYARIDFSGFQITASMGLHFNFSKTGGGQ